MKKVKPIALSTHLKLPASQLKTNKKVNTEVVNVKSRKVNTTKKRQQPEEGVKDNNNNNNNNDNENIVVNSNNIINSNTNSNNDYEMCMELSEDSADEWMQPVRDDANNSSNDINEHHIDTLIHDSNHRQGNTDTNDDKTHEICKVTSNSHRSAARHIAQEMNAIERELAGESVRVQFNLPDGSVCESSFFMGETVQHMKCMLEAEKGLSYEKTTLYMNEEMLLDPLSLNDLPFSAEKLNVVDVKIINA